MMWFFFCCLLGHTASCDHQHHSSSWWQVHQVQILISLWHTHTHQWNCSWSHLHNACTGSCILVIGLFHYVEINVLFCSTTTSFIKNQCIVALHISMFKRWVWQWFEYEPVMEPSVAFTSLNTMELKFYYSAVFSEIKCFLGHLLLITTHRNGIALIGGALSITSKCGLCHLKFSLLGASIALSLVHPKEWKVSKIKIWYSYT